MAATVTLVGEGGAPARLTAGRPHHRIRSTRTIPIAPDEEAFLLGGPLRTQDGPAPRSADGSADQERASHVRRYPTEDGTPDPVPTWDEIATKYGRKVYTIAYRLTGDPEEAKDLAQDVFVRVYRNLDKYEPGTFEGWLYRITKNLFLDRVRRQRRVRWETLPDEEWRQPEDEGPGPEDHLETGVLRADIELAITQLPPDFRTAVVLCDVQGLAYEEIAEATGWPLGTVRSRIHRGRKLLRKQLTAGAERERRA